jgi:ABC-2 type transport system ATP-binding protein
MQEMIKTINLEKVFSPGKKAVYAVNKVTLTVNKGEVFALLGPNGAGKTTLIKMLLDFIRPTDGEAFLLGKPAHTHSIRKKLGYVPEDLHLPDFSNANKFLEFFGRLSGVASNGLNSKILKLLNQTELYNVKQSIKKYSKGMKRRLSLTQAFLHDPELLILDEPTDGLDPIERRRVLNFLQAYKESGGTILLCSHILTEVEKICDRYAIIKNGRIVQQGTNKDFSGQGYQIIVENNNTNKCKKLLPEGCKIEKSQDESKIILTNEKQLTVVLSSLNSLNMTIKKIDQSGISLNDIFLKYVNKEEANQ